MNRGHVFESSPVQQLMMASNWWTINHTRMPPPPPPPQQTLFPAGVLPFPQFIAPSLPPPWLDHHEIPESWSQLLVCGLGSEEDKSAMSQEQSSRVQSKKLETWEENLLRHQHQDGSIGDDPKHENSANGYGHGSVEFLQTSKPTNWSPMTPASSPKSCVTSLSNNMLDFSNHKADARHPPSNLLSECNSSAAGGAPKKAKVQPSSSSQCTFKVRKEKLGDRITVLHQLVSPFGKTDTASVLLEAIGYIRFLQGQIEALSLPYLGTGSANQRHQHPLFNDHLKKKGAPEQGSEEESKDLRSRGLCLVPVPCTMQVENDNGADYWAPAVNGGFR